METSTLFDFVARGIRAQAEVNKLCQQPLTHTADPQTSYDAAERMLESGALSEQENLVFSWIKEYLEIHPKAKDFTARELAMWRYANQYHVIQRRLSGLRNKGKIERISINNTGKPPWKNCDGFCV